MTFTFNDFMKEQMQDPEFRAEYEALDLEKEIMQAMIEAREKNGITQQELAEKTGLAQSEISQLESGYLDPSFATFVRLANGMGMKLKLKVELQPA